MSVKIRKYRKNFAKPAIKFKFKMRKKKKFMKMKEMDGTIFKDSLPNVNCKSVLQKDSKSSAYDRNIRKTNLLTNGNAFSKITKNVTDHADIDDFTNRKKRRKRKRKQKPNQSLITDYFSNNELVSPGFPAPPGKVNNVRSIKNKKKRRHKKSKIMSEGAYDGESCPNCSTKICNGANGDSSFDELPVNACRKQFVHYFKENDTLIVVGETGAGKSTQIPQIIHKYILNENGRIAITQPRRVAVLSISSRVAEELSSVVGETVGYSIRFDSVKHQHTKIIFFTDGMLIREFFNDELLLSYDYVILDEAHERTVHTDVLFGLVKRAQKRRRKAGHKPLKVVVMSATMNVDHYSEYFNKALVIYLEGRNFPIRVFHIAKEEEDYVTSCLILLFKIHRNAPANHDVLMILTGQNEIEATAQTIKKISNGLQNYPKMIVCTLYSSMDPYKQRNVFLQTPQGSRKVILSTNIAETSITIKGIKYVIDSGKVKIKTYDNITGIETLKVQTISQAQAFQRAGRAGRETDGFVYRAYTVQQYDEMDKFTVPELLRCNLSSVILNLLHMKINPYVFDFMDKPPKEDIVESVTQLTELGAARIEDDKPCIITKLGHQMALLPLDPRYSKILISAPSYGCLTEVITIIAFLSADSIFINPTTENFTSASLEKRNQLSSPHGDLITFLNIYKTYKSLRDNKDEWCRNYYLNKFNIKYALNVRKQLVTLCRDVLHLEFSSCDQNFESVCKCLIIGLYRNVAVLKSNRTYATSGSTRLTKIHPASIIAHNSPSAILFCEMIKLNETYLKNVTVIDVNWVSDVVPNVKNYKKINSGST